MIVDDLSEVKVVQRIFSEFANDGRSMSDIASRLTADKIPSPNGHKRWRFDAIKVILSNPAYIGTVRFNTWSYSKYHSYQGGEIVKGGRRGRNPPKDWIVHTDKHEPIVDRELFEKAQAILAKGKIGRSRLKPENNPYLLSGKLRCGRCGGTLWGEDSNRRSFECSRAKYDGDCKGTRCREPNVLDQLAEKVKTEFIENAAQNELMKKAKGGQLMPDDLPAAFKKLKRLLLGDEPTKVNTNQLKRQIGKIDRDIERAKENLFEIRQPENVKYVEDKIEGLKTQRSEMVSELNTQPTERDINEVVRDVFKKLILLATGKPELMKPVIRELDSITVFTKIAGKGTRRRHTLERVEVHFCGVGGVTGNSNPHLPG